MKEVIINMARHNDISRAHALLEGVNWHIEKLGNQNTTGRRDKRRCIFYEKSNKFCEDNNKKCPGSTNCFMYREY